MFGRILKTQCLSPKDAENNYLDKSKNQNHRMARQLICLEIRRYLSLPYAPIAQVENGETFLYGHDYSMSITHKEEHFGLAITKEYDSIGIDLECFDEKIDWSVFNGRFFNREDWFLIQRISSLKKISTSQAYAILFCAKEAVLKASKLKVDPLEINFVVSNIFKNKKKIQLNSAINYEQHIFYFKTEIIWKLNTSKNLPSIISLCVLKKNPSTKNNSLFLDSKIFIQVPSLL